MVNISSPIVPQISSPINFVFLSCHWPPRFRFFVQQLKMRGVSVLGIGDELYENLHVDLKENLQEYYLVSDMENYDELYRCLGHFVHKYGRIQFIESLNEHWLETEARLREDFNVFGGYRPTEMAMYKRKSGMKKVYEGAGLKCAPGFLPSTLEEAVEFATKTGYPLVMKPDNGVGASATYKIKSEEELRQYWDNSGNQFLEQWVQGTIETYDGICDHEGNTVFYSSMHYGGLMEVVSGQNESMCFYVNRDVPDDLKEMGDTTLRAFNVRSRFFHCEFFRTTDGRLLPLEINLRPPGVITVDVMNYTYRVDLYAEFAKVVCNQPVAPYKQAEHYGVYTGRRDTWQYCNSHDDVCKKLGNKLELTYTMPSIYSGIMGNQAYVFTSETKEEMKEVVQFIEARYRLVQSM